MPRYGKLTLLTSWPSNKICMCTHTCAHVHTTTTTITTKPSCPEATSKVNVFGGSASCKVSTAGGYRQAPKISFQREAGLCSNSRRPQTNVFLEQSNSNNTLCTYVLLFFGWAQGVWYYRTPCVFVPVRKWGGCFHSFFVHGASGTRKVTTWPTSPDAF